MSWYEQSVRWHKQEDFEGPYRIAISSVSTDRDGSRLSAWRLKLALNAPEEVIGTALELLNRMTKEGYDLKGTLPDGSMIFVKHDCPLCKLADDTKR
jgi:hypothetical protein